MSMDPIDLDWQITQGWPGDETATGYVPTVDEHVFCYRPSDGATRCGWVDDNRMGLFLTSCAHGRVVLTAARWNVQPMQPAPSCRQGPTTQPVEGDQVT